MKHGDISDWLSQVDSAACLKPTGNNHQPLSPESHKRRQIMADDDDSHPTPKRQRLQGNSLDMDETPRASSSLRGQRYHIQAASPTTSLPSRSNSQSTKSQGSGYLSTSKRIAALELSSEGIETRALSLENPSLPPALSQLLVELEGCISGFGVISSNRKSEIKEQCEKDPRFRVFMDFMYSASADRDKLGPTPSLDEVIHLVGEAAECQTTMQSEAGWNIMVHLPLLYKAIYGQRRQNQIVGFAPCTTAKIIKEYLATSSQAKMVDFCICIMPEVEDIAANAITRLRQVLPYNVINHTDFLPVRNRPIAISIETKKRGGAHLVTAELQLGTWHAAQWRFLEDLVTRSGGSFDGLPFLPAVVVQGHDWSFAATTREGQKPYYG